MKWFLQKFRKNIDFSQNIRKLRFFRIFPKISILVDFSKYLDFGQSFPKISIYLKITKNFNFIQIFEKKK